MSEDTVFLLDTHTFLWMASSPERLGSEARSRIEDSGSQLLLSLASVWEMAIKSSLGKLELPAPLGSFVGQQREALRTRFLDIRLEHILEVEHLPFHHRDPFDRLLAAQASFEGLPILSGDSSFDGYQVARIW